MGRSPCCEKVGLKKGPWTPEEDQKLLAYIEEYGHGSWRALPAKAGLQRCGKSCRLRWTNYLRPDIKRGKFSLQEEQTIIQLHALLGNRWSAIATHLPKRTDNEIKNYWNTHLKKRLAKMGIDPVTHKPKSDTLSPANGQSTKSIANLSHMSQWESARLEAEARLVRESKLRAPSASTPTSTSLQSPLQQQDTAVLLPQLHNKSVSNTTMSSPDVIRTRQAGLWPKSANGSQGQIDLQSPTSTLSFSAESMVQPSMGILGQNSTIMCRQEDEGLEGEEELGFKCFGKPIRLSDTKDHRTDDLPAAGFSMNMITEASWLIPESSSIRIGSSSRDFGPAGLFTEMLLDNSDEQNSCANYSDNAEGGSCVEEEYQDEDENNSYWNNILELVNSSPPSNSPPPVF